MAHALKISNDAINAQADALARKLDNGFLRLYNGTQAADADTPVGAQTLLAELRLANPSAPAAVAGVLTFSALTPDVSADATGTATWFRALKADGTTVVMDGTVGLVGSSSDLELDAVAIQANADVVVDSWTHTVPKT
jgi:hypothetical protein